MKVTYSIKRHAIEYLNRNNFPKNDYVQRERALRAMTGFSQEREEIINKRFNTLINIYYKAYSKPMPLWRYLFCTKKDNLKWYTERCKKMLDEFYNKKNEKDNKTGV